MQQIRNALMLIFQVKWQAAATRAAVEEIFFPALPANFASRAMILAFICIIIEQLADCAIIFAEYNMTFLAFLLYLLTRIKPQFAIPLEQDRTICI